MIVLAATSEFTGTYLPVLVGVVIGAVGVLMFVGRSRALKKAEETGQATRAGALRSVLGSFVVVALLFLAGAVVSGNGEFLTATMLITLTAVGGLVFGWRRTSQ